MLETASWPHHLSLSSHFLWSILSILLLTCVTYMKVIQSNNILVIENNSLVLRPSHAQYSYAEVAPLIILGISFSSYYHVAK